MGSSSPSRSPLAIGTAGLLSAGNAGAEDLQGKLDSKKAALGDAQHKKGVLTTDIDNYNNKIDTLTGQVASLRNREAVVRADLREAAVPSQTTSRTTSASSACGSSVRSRSCASG